VLANPNPRKPPSRGPPSMVVPGLVKGMALRRDQEGSPQ
jgi:hypothetical protein